MRKFLALAFTLFIAFTSSAFAQDALTKALDDFHQTLAFTYHPMVDDSNLTPIKTRSHELAQKAKAVDEAFESVKEKYQALEPAIERLESECEALDGIIQKGATDEAIRSRLTIVHDKFHEIESGAAKIASEK